MKRIASLLMMVIAVVSALNMNAQSRVVSFGSPDMKVFLPPASIANGKAVLCCPGGGYSVLASDHEGYDWAPYFNNLGFAYAVVRYRMPNGDKTIPMNDVAQCFKILRDSAAVWHFSPEQIGIMGSSAGGHLASTIATHPSTGCNPAFQILFYPVISLAADITHHGTRHGFLGDNPSEEEVAAWSSDNNVSSATPPAFLVLCSDDTVVPPANSILYYNALVANHIPASMFIYPTGNHGWGYHTTFSYHTQMLSELTTWLRKLTE